MMKSGVGWGGGGAAEGARASLGDVRRGELGLRPDGHLPRESRHEAGGAAAGGPPGSCAGLRAARAGTVRSLGPQSRYTRRRADAGGGLVRGAAGAVQPRVPPAGRRSSGSMYMYLRASPLIPSALSSCGLRAARRLRPRPGG